MTRLMGHEIGKGELLRRIGHLSQVAGIRRMTLSDGVEDGVRIADVRTGSGLRFQVTLDRGMDISMAEFRGVPLAWRSPTGDAHPSFYDGHGLGWLRTFPGGLMTGCGITSLGAPGTDGGVALGLHGRLSHLPATDVVVEHRWEGEECLMAVEGSMREAVIFGENMHLRRRIETRLGSSVVTLRDRVVNEGSSRTPLMMLYHINLGWPLVDAGARLLLHATGTTPRDPDAAAGLATVREFSAPVPGFREQVYYHDLAPESDGYATALLRDAAGRLGLQVRFRQRELPKFIQWKMTGEGSYVVGLEPANCRVSGRAAERVAGTLEFLDPGEAREFALEFALLEGEDAIATAVRTHALT
jgi:hypothetical protein